MANYLKAIRGKVIRSKPVKVRDEQIKLGKPKMIELELYRNDERKEFEIYLSMPWGNLYKIECHQDETKARARYLYLLKQLKSGKAEIEIGSSFKVIV